MHILSANIPRWYYDDIIILIIVSMQMLNLSSLPVGPGQTHRTTTKAMHGRNGMLREDESVKGKRLHGENILLLESMGVAFLLKRIRVNWLLIQFGLNSDKSPSSMNTMLTISLPMCRFLSTCSRCVGIDGRKLCPQSYRIGLYVQQQQQQVQRFIHTAHEKKRKWHTARAEKKNVNVSPVDTLKFFIDQHRQSQSFDNNNS